MDTTYRDRTEAGTVLADHLGHLAHRADVTVLGLVRGGVPVAAAVARRLAAPLDVLVVRKLGLPLAPELAFGAVGPGGVRVLNQQIAARLAPDEVEAVVRAETAELRRREQRYRADRPPLRLDDRIAVEDPQRTDTTLLIHPHVLQDFLDYNDFLDVADAVLDELDLEGVLQVASFHPHYQFAGTAEDDVENCTNRSPYPTLHLLREDSIERAVQAFPEPEAIYEANIRTLRALGREGFERLLNDDAAPGR